VLSRQSHDCVKLLFVLSPRFCGGIRHLSRFSVACVALPVPGGYAFVRCVAEFVCVGSVWHLLHQLTVLCRKMTRNSKHSVYDLYVMIGSALAVDSEGPGSVHQCLAQCLWCSGICFPRLCMDIGNTSLTLSQTVNLPEPKEYMFLRVRITC
jgi:hypothetical protein